MVGDTIQIMLSYIEPQEAAGIVKSVYGRDLLNSQEPVGKGDAMDSDQVMRYIQTSLKELQYGTRALLAG